MNYSPAISSVFGQMARTRKQRSVRRGIGVAPSTLLRRRDRTPETAADAPDAIEFTWANRRPGTAGFARWVAAASHRIGERGWGDTARDLEILVAVARQLGVVPVAVGVLADPTEADVARLRALAVVSAAIVKPPSTSSEMSPPAERLLAG